MKLTIQFKVSESIGQISVKDNGEGMNPDKVKHIFKMFNRQSSSATGSGLGLYICNQMIQKLRGTINVESKETEGTTFTIKIPQNKPL